MRTRTARGESQDAEEEGQGREWAGPVSFQGRGDVRTRPWRMGWRSGRQSRAHQGSLATGLGRVQKEFIRM